MFMVRTSVFNVNWTIFMHFLMCCVCTFLFIIVRWAAFIERTWSINYLHTHICLIWKSTGTGKCVIAYKYAGSTSCCSCELQMTPLLTSLQAACTHLCSSDSHLHSARLQLWSSLLPNVNVSLGIPKNEGEINYKMKSFYRGNALTWFSYSSLEAQEWQEALSAFPLSRFLALFGMVWCGLVHGIFHKNANKSKREKKENI